MRPWAILQSYYKQFGKQDLLVESLKQKNLMRKKKIFTYLSSFAMSTGKRLYIDFAFSLN